MRYEAWYAMEDLKRVGARVTYRYELNNLSPILDILLHVDGEGRTHQGVQEQVIALIVLFEGCRFILWLRRMRRLVASSAVDGRACWCHGSCPRSSWAREFRGLQRSPSSSHRGVRTSLLNALPTANHDAFFELDTFLVPESFHSHSICSAESYCCDPHLTYCAYLLRSSLSLTQV